LQSIQRWRNAVRATAFAAVAATALGLTSHARADDLADAYSRGMAELRAGDYVAALPYFEKALELSRERYGDDHPQLAVELNNLGEVHRQIGNYDEAEALLNQALALDARNDTANLGANATSLNNLALIARARGDYARAFDLYRQSREKMEAAYGVSHPDIAKNLNNMAMLYVDRGEPQKAEPLARRALEIARDELGEQHPVTQAISANVDGIAMENLQAANQTPAAEEEDLARLRPASAQPVVNNPVRKPEMPEPAEVAAAEPVRLAAPQPRPETATDSDATVAVQENAPTPEPAPTRANAADTVAAIKEPEGAQPQATAGADVNGGFQIHLASVRSPESATSEWQRYGGMYPDLQSIRQNPPEKVTVEGKGDFYRVVGGHFGSRDAATKFCSLIEEKGQYCAVLEVR
jgi:tetratricopeptide (TPR) repeat protein